MSDQQHAFAEHRRVVDRIRMRWEQHGEGYPLVLVHGIPTSPALWRHVIPKMTGARCLAWEMVGYGDSIPEGEGRDISVAKQADYLLAWLKALGIQRAVLAGHDLGGGVVQIAAAREPSVCAGLFLTNAISYDSWPIPSVKAMQALSGVMEHLPDALLKLVLNPLFVRGHDDEERGRESFDLHFEKYARQDGAAALIRQVNALDVRDTLVIADRLPALDMPARIVWGAIDPFQKVEYGERLARDLKAPLRRIEQGRHFTPEDHPDVIAAELTSLLATVRDGGHVPDQRRSEPRAPAGSPVHRAVVVFDVVGTLFDVSSLDPLFKKTFGEAAVRKEWFSQLLQLAFVATITGSYVEFSKLAETALAMTAARHGTTLSAKERDEILSGMGGLPAFPDVRSGLERLRAAGVRMVALTNSSMQLARGLLADAGLSDFFETVLSTDEVRRFKPAPETYRMAATKLGISPADMTLVAAHWWDLFGAVRVGCQSGFLQRPGMVLDPSAPPPRYEAVDLPLLVDQILSATVK